MAFPRDKFWWGFSSAYVDFVVRYSCSRAAVLLVTSRRLTTVRWLVGGSLLGRLYSFLSVVSRMPCRLVLTNCPPLRGEFELGGSSSASVVATAAAIAMLAVVALVAATATLVAAAVAITMAAATAVVASVATVAAAVAIVVAAAAAVVPLFGQRLLSLVSLVVLASVALGDRLCRTGFPIEWASASQRSSAFVETCRNVSSDAMTSSISSFACLVKASVSALVTARFLTTIVLRSFVSGGRSVVYAKLLN